MNAAAQYLARLYEPAVDRGLDVEAIRLFLAARGIPRTPGQVRDDLDSVFAFHRYAASHPAQPILTLKQADAGIDH
jgi:hypothetical protein